MDIQIASILIHLDFLSIYVLNTVNAVSVDSFNPYSPGFSIYFEKDFNSPEKVMARALILADKKIREKDFLIDNLHQRIVEQTPKVEFAEAFEISASSVLIGELAKMINQNGIDIGQNRLFSLLRDRGYLCNRGEQRNLPTQKSLDLGLMEIKKSIINQGDGVTRVTTTPKVTSKGQSYFINKMLFGEKEI